VRGEINELEVNSNKRHIRKFYIGMNEFKRVTDLEIILRKTKGLFDSRSAQNFEQMKRKTCYILNVNGVS
jgi:hypothetical protein